MFGGSLDATSEHWSARVNSWSVGVVIGSELKAGSEVGFDSRSRSEGMVVGSALKVGSDVRSNPQVWIRGWFRG